MKAILRLSIALALLTTMPGSTAWSQGVHYDFDSLLQHNSQFESLASIVFDTFKIFGPEQPLEFTVSTDLRALAKNKYDDEYQTADVIFNLWDTINISREIRIKPRGEFRLKNCSNPPLRVNVKKTEEVFQLLDGLSKLKMVVPCKGASSYQHYILNEYMAYKLYNIITENSFLVRLIKVHYYDTGGKVKEGEAYTFIIESEKAMAKRLGSIPIDNEKINARYLDPETAAVLYLYQFMIGNTDWSVPGLHNMKLIKTSNVTRPNPIPVTYDLDYSGFVNASYAIPGDHVSIKEVTEREYMGYCLPPEHMEKAFDLFIQKEPQIIAAVEKFSLISDRQKKICLNFLDEFFEIIKNPRSRENRIIARCKK